MAAPTNRRRWSPSEPPLDIRLRLSGWAGLVREWLAELKVVGCSDQTLKWYQQKMDWYLGHEGGPATLDGLKSAEIKRLLGSLIDRGLAPNTVHGFFEVVRIRQLGAARGICGRPCGDQDAAAQGAGY